MIIKKHIYGCVKCKYKTNYMLRKLIHDKLPGHKMILIGCQKKLAKYKAKQQFES